MSLAPVLARPSVTTIIVAAALSSSIAIALLVAVAALFVHEGVPLHNVAIAERACSDLTFVSEREVCMRSFLAASAHRHVASR